MFLAEEKNNQFKPADTIIRIKDIKIVIEAIVEIFKIFRTWGDGKE